MKKLYFFFLLVLVFASAGGAPTTKKTKIEIVYKELSNGDYRLYLFGSDRALVCEEKDIKIVQQGDALDPIVLECKH